MDKVPELTHGLTLEQIPQLETPNREGVFVFRYDNPTIPNNHPNSSTSNDGLVGRWFTDSLHNLASVIALRPPGGNLLVTSIPKDELEQHRGLNNPIVQEQDMEIEKDIFIVSDEMLANSRTIPFPVPASGKRFTLEDRRRINDFLLTVPDMLINPQEPQVQAA